MNNRRDFIVCPRRTGRHRVPVEVCSDCRHKATCQAWRDYKQPALFPGLHEPPKKQRG